MVNSPKSPGTPKSTRSPRSPRTPNNNANFRFGHLERSLFSNNDGDYASSFMNQGANNELNRRPAPANPPDYEHPEYAQNYNGPFVYTGESWVYAPRPRLANESAAGSSISAGSQGSVHGSPRRPGTSLAAPAAPGDAQSSPQAYGIVPRSPASPAAPAAATARPSSPLSEDAEWSSEDILKLYKWKMVKKKGNALILKQFPGETEASLNAAWRKYREEGQRLFDEEEKEEEE